MSSFRSASQRIRSTVDRIRTGFGGRTNAFQPQGQPQTRPLTTGLSRPTGYSMRDSFEPPRGRSHPNAQMASADLSQPHPHDGHGDSVGAAAGSTPGANEVRSPNGVAHTPDGASARALGQAIVGRNTTGRAIDTSGVYRELQSFVNEPSHAQAERGAVVASALGALPADHRRSVATALVDGTRADGLDTISRAGIEAMHSALGADEATRAQRTALDTELARRGPVQERIVNQVRILGDEVSTAAMDAAAAQVRVLTTGNPEVTAAMRGTTVVVTPSDEYGTDQDLVFDAIGIHGRQTHDGRMWDTVGGAAAGKFLYVNERDLVGARGRPGELYTTNHEFSHAVQYAYVNALPANDPRLTGLLNPGTSVRDSDGNGRVTGADVMKLAWEQRLAAGRLADDYSASNQNEWFAQAGSSYAGAQGRASPVDAQWMYDRDRPLYDLLQSVYGPTPQSVDTTGTSTGTGRARQQRPFWAGWF